MAGKFKILIFFTVFFTQHLFAQISPGELSKAHANLEGISNCTRCHILGEKVASSKCLECHTEIKNLIAQKKGYHSSTEVSSKECASCHGEHFGRDFEIVRFDTLHFNHDLAGYKLEGKHTQISCSTCHTRKLIRENISQNKGKTFLGLGITCLSCHTDYHQGTLPNDCSRCHNQEKFKPAPFFNHDRSDFPLIGKHKSVGCEKCHKIETLNGKTFQAFANVPHSGCISCHVDVHKNKFGSNCTRCHSEESFTDIKSISSFDHSKTNYPLEGSHRVVDCVKCHKGSYTKPLKFNLCSDCHADYHNGQFLKNGKNPDCSECHSVKNFTATLFTIEQHNSSGFKLEGSHISTPCIRCHQKEGKWEFKSIGTNCSDCHENIHRDYIQEKYFNNGGCRNCHLNTTWQEIKFDHNTTLFALTGKHRETDCRQCHFDKTGGQHFKGLDQNCSTCHTDVHNNQFAENNRTDCGKCHITDDWNPVKFNHDNTRFKLDGAHAGLECTRCHKPAVQNGRRYIIYKIENITCASCHS